MIAAEVEVGQHELVAFIVADPSAVSVAEIREYLGRRLVDAMVPSHFEYLDSLPTSPNGKVDRRALLSATRLGRTNTSRRVAPRTAVEGVLAGIWERTLGVDCVGVHDNFFELGGDSLLALRLLSQIRVQTDADVPLRLVFERPTIAGIAQALRGYECALVGEGDVGDGGGLPELEPAWGAWYEAFPLTDIQQAYWLGRSGVFELGEVGAHGYREFETDGLDVGRFRVGLAAAGGSARHAAYGGVGRRAAASARGCSGFRGSCA